MTNSCDNCIWQLDHKCVNADSFYVKGFVTANIFCPLWDYYKEDNNGTNMERQHFH